MKRNKLKIQSAIRPAIQPLALPAWLTGARRCELYQLVARECAQARLSLTPRHVCGLIGFAHALEWLETVIKNAKDSPWLDDAGGDVIEWAEVFGFDDEATRRLLAAVGVRRASDGR